MLSLIKQRFKKILHSIGIEAHRYRPETSPLARLMSTINAFEIDLIIDIGANDGQFSNELRSGGYTGRIVSFEPLTSAYQRLLQMSNHDSKWDVHERCAIGNSHDEVTMNISRNSVSSSVLPMLDAHIEAAPESAYTATETAPQNTLDSVILPYLDDAKSILLKIDTQGYEWQILDGAVTTLPKVSGIMMELSLVPLYEKQHLWLECVERLERGGLKLWSLEPVFNDLVTGQTLQCDGLFFRQ